MPTKAPHRRSILGPLLTIGLLALFAMMLLPSTPRRSTQGEKGLRIIADFLPTYVFTLNVVGNTPGVAVDLLIAPNVGCPHDYALRPADLQRVAQANVIVANGLGLDAFLGQLTKSNPHARVITISDDADVIHTPEEHDEHGHEEDVNPHVWVSPAQAIRQVRTLAGKLSEIDPPHASAYRSNAEAYTRRLQGLLQRMQHAAAGFANRNIVTFHDAFDYLARDLNLNVVATLTQDPERGPSAAQLAAIIDTVRQTHPAAIFYEPAYPDRLARAVGRDAGVPVYPLNPFNSMDTAPARDSYEQVMEQNLRTLQQALDRPSTASTGAAP